MIYRNREGDGIGGIEAGGSTIIDGGPWAQPFPHGDLIQKIGGDGLY